MCTKQAWGLNLARALKAQRQQQLKEEAEAKPAEGGNRADYRKSLSWAALTKSEPLVPLEMLLPPLNEHMVEIQVTHTALCAADVEYMDGQLGGEDTVFPAVSGGQMVGVVTQVGEGVHRLKRGDRVGLGWLKGACFECRLCCAGKEHLCASAVNTFGGGQRGGLTDVYRADARFAFNIPQKIGSAEAAPLLSSGLTAFSALEHTRPGDAVGVIGIGGVGHLALQIAAKRGCIVTAISSSAKEMGARELGAHDFIELDKVSQAAAGSLDFILVASSKPVDMAIIRHLLAAEGTVCFLMGSAANNTSLDLHSMVRRGQRFVTAASGGRRDMDAFMRFVSVHNIKPRVETTSISRVNNAIAKLRANELRYCLVLEA